MQDSDFPIEENQNTENENTQPPEKPSRRAVSFAFDILEMFAWSVFAVIILFTFFVRLCRVEGSSMENTLYNGQNLLLYSVGYTPKTGDIVVFHLTENENSNTEKRMVKRVIATEGQTVQINFNTGEILIDGVTYDDTHAVLKDRFTGKDLGYYNLFADYGYDVATNTFSATVPSGHVFVMGDNRNNSKDSRDADIGFVDARCILGKAIVRLAPFAVFS